MLERLRNHLTYANVMATLAVFIALGGSSYAVSRISGSQLKNHSVTGKKLKRNTLGGGPIKESRLGLVRRAKRANDARRLQGASKATLRVHCPRGTAFLKGVCVETGFRSPQAYTFAENTCESAGRRLPSYAELATAVDGTLPFASSGELTQDVYPTSSEVRALVVTTRFGNVTTTPNTFAGRRSFRCVAYPSNR